MTWVYISQKDVLCHVTLKKFEEECNWYANFCTSCGAEITKVDGRFFCHNNECMRVIPYPEKRFRLCTVCFDKTGILPIIFPDDEIQRLTGKDAFEIINDDTQVGEGIDFPPLLKQFEMKEYILTLTPSAQNINKSSKVFTAKKVDNPQEIFGNYDPNIPQSPEIKELYVTIESKSEEVPKSEGPPTGKSSTRSRRTKTKAVLKCDLDDQSPHAKLKKS
ncbi:hypothetical protein POM88_051536 [Heracleum sosnowskyi]|uniref:Replication factor A C-terminal domain-containing protein n=1 Tax=Heracleum sosnowskyi TaxID=360622 RepID=A0AAD8GZS3_9APIA|nr:hypothetical protein POM88_051536 [Heracleum sosnowskyi]